MSLDAQTQFLDGMPVSHTHLQHLQDRLLDAILDLRRAAGLGRIIYGLKIITTKGLVTLSPGVAFHSGGARLTLDVATPLAVPSKAGTWRVVLRGQNAGAHWFGRPTIITLKTEVVLEPTSEPESPDISMTIGQISRGPTGIIVGQDEGLFVATGGHAHSGAHVRDEADLWHFDGVPFSEEGVLVLPQGPVGPQGPEGVAGPQGAAGSPGPQGLPGAKGATGPAGSAGSVGPTGATGPEGVELPQGWPVVTAVSWIHGTRLSVADAVTLLGRTLTCSLSSPPSTRAGIPPWQVTFEQQGASSPCYVLHGTAGLDATKSLLTWLCSDSSSSLTTLLTPGGRLKLRVHCWALKDKNNVQYSASPTWFIGTSSPRRPGGVLESWVFIS